MLPDLDGLEVLRLLRSRGVSTPVLMLTALGTLDHRVSGLDAGADDYLPKPFAFAELLARLRALARRAPDLTDEQLSAGDIQLDPVRHRVTVGDASEDLSAREYALLGYLIRQEGRVVTRQQILDAVWGAEPDVYSNVVDLYVHYLRRKLETLGRREALRTVRASAMRCRPTPAARHEADPARRQRPGAASVTGPTGWSPRPSVGWPRSRCCWWPRCWWASVSRPRSWPRGSWTPTWTARWRPRPRRDPAQR